DRQKKGYFSRYVLPLVLLILVVGAVAWISQNLPTTMPKQGPVIEPERHTKTLEFVRIVSNWDTESGQGGSHASMDFKEFEPGTKGHYDFPFKNVFDGDVELWLESAAGCDCATVFACLLPESEWNVVSESMTKVPGNPLPYTREPTWTEMHSQK